MRIISQAHAAAPEEYDINKLARAVAVAETGNCTNGKTAVERSNCHGIMTWNNGVRTLKSYPSKDASYADFKRIWTTYYGRFPDLDLAKKWTGADNAAQWLRIVQQKYDSL